MKMKAYLYILGFTTFLSLNSIAQNSINLEECRQKAVENYPLIGQYGLIELAEKYTIENIGKSYLPQLSFNAQATYQSDVTNLPVDLSSLPISFKIPTLDKDQYKAILEVSQVIWDGGASGSQKKITRASGEVEKQKLEVSLYSIKEKVNQLYFGILAIDMQLGLLDILGTDLETNLKLAESMYKNGVAMESDIDLIQVEILNLRQNITEQISTRDAYLKMLSLFTGENLDKETILELPAGDYSSVSPVNRSELVLYNRQRDMYKEQLSSVTAKNMPKIGLFVQGGYGRPGLNMLEPDFKFFAIGGVKLSWNFGNLYTKKNEKKLIANSINSTNTEEDTFLFNTNIQLIQSQDEITKYKKLMEGDDEIILLRARVKTASESKYKNGVYQINELIRDINAENQARQTKAIHKIQYLMNIHSYKHIQGY